MWDVLGHTSEREFRCPADMWRELERNRSRNRLIISRRIFRLANRCKEIVSAEGIKPSPYWLRVSRSIQWRDLCPFTSQVRVISSARLSGQPGLVRLELISESSATRTISGRSVDGKSANQTTRRVDYLQNGLLEMGPACRIVGWNVLMESSRRARGSSIEYA